MGDIKLRCLGVKNPIKQKQFLVDSIYIVNAIVWKSKFGGSITIISEKGRRALGFHVTKEKNIYFAGCVFKLMLMPKVA